MTSTQIFFCRPISGNFNIKVFSSHPLRKCVDFVASTWSIVARPANIVFCTLTVVTDLMRNSLSDSDKVMFIPMKTLSKLRIDWKRKLSVIVLFALGFLAVFAAIIRCVLFLKDATVIKVMMWSGIEQAVCYLVANAPALRPLLFRDKFHQSRGTHELSGGRSVDEYELSLCVKEHMGGVVSVGVPLV